MVYVVVGCFWFFVFGAEGCVRGFDCLCATEPPFSSGNNLSNSGAASLAQALEKNTTLQRLDLDCEFVVLLRALEGGLIVVYVIVGCFWFLFGVEGFVFGVECLCATEPPFSSDNPVSPALSAIIGSVLEVYRQV